MTLTLDLEKQLKTIISVKRLARTGFFTKLKTEDDKYLSSELALHLAVLDRALMDYFHKDPEIKKSSQDWLDLRNLDFLECCERCFLEPEKVFEAFKLIEELNKGKKCTTNRPKITRPFRSRKN